MTTNRHRVPGEVREHIDSVKKNLPGVKVRIGTIGDFGDRMAGGDLSDLPVVSKDMPDSWIHGPTSNPDRMILARKAVPELFASESLHSLLGTWGVEGGDAAGSTADGHKNGFCFMNIPGAGRSGGFAGSVRPGPILARLATGFTAISGRRT